MRKYLLNGGVVSAALGVIPLLRKTAVSTGRGSTIVAWLVWAGTIATAVIAVREQLREERERAAESAE